ncbi:hypothetical protein ACRE_067300 [Hapsidospora chrysogenum ATCC 11550]|uniref:Uncharacterized protein n=1 Tax=Hapsidospora chrysogenum (strain ATCC 11550 / CBS 779.69 / DSM 880 / IAM 14645 / JCM 23072 / IMI 49137) TaxID=857340 RepID=A0A086SZL8_HAPC1|nr:hypothetical protein ACRE_067300 [Hapsidospora chrysogenum ATCC 11550]
MTTGAAGRQTTSFLRLAGPPGALLETGERPWALQAVTSVSKIRSSYKVPARAGSFLRRFGESAKGCGFREEDGIVFVLGNHRSLGCRLQEKSRAYDARHPAGFVSVGQDPGRLTA